MKNRTPLQVAALVVGAVFLVVGILGFIPGITTNYDDLGFVGHDSHAKLLGIFQVNGIHNIVHLLFGVVGLAAAKSWQGSRLFLVGGGAVYLALWLYGLVVDFDSAFNFVSLNTADNWLHFLLGVGMIGIGLALGRTQTRSRVAPA
jgi:hypothetical protein